MFNLVKKLEKYSTIFVDIDDTLFNYATANRSAILEVLYKHGFTVSEFEAAYSNIKSRGLTTNHHRKELYFKYMVEQATRPLEDVLDMFNTYTIAFNQNLQVDRSMLNALRKFKIDGKDIIAITNFYVIQQLEKLKVAGFISLVDNMVTSEEFEQEKPSVTLLNRALELAKVDDRSTVVMIGDSIVDDMTIHGIDYYPYNSSKLLISVSGKSGAGKTTLAAGIKDALKAYVINGDGYHLYERNNKAWENLTHYNPAANNLIRLALDVKNIYQNVGSVDIPLYDHASGSLGKSTRIEPENVDVVIIDGLHSLYKEVTGEFVKINIYLDTKYADQQKIDRDMKKRSYTEDAVLESIRKREADYSDYVAVQKQYANFVIDVVDDNFLIKLTDDFDLTIFAAESSHQELKFVRTTMTDTLVEFVGKREDLVKTVSLIMNILYKARYE